MRLRVPDTVLLIGAMTAILAATSGRNRGTLPVMLTATATLKRCC